MIFLTTQLCPGTRAAKGMVGSEQGISGLHMCKPSGTLIHKFIPVHTMGNKGIQDLPICFRPGSWWIDVFNANNPFAVMGSGIQKADQGT